mmetsp:Transcript_2793/g.5413  ORF Transcript_2793/g.5413 Transcript_2793/m.5413 type:complete len:222 (-) Transcript_2793:30-695(-)
MADRTLRHDGMHALDEQILERIPLVGIIRRRYGHVFDLHRTPHVDFDDGIGDGKGRRRDRRRGGIRAVSPLRPHAGDAFFLGPAGVAAGFHVAVGVLGVVRHGRDVAVGADTLSVDDVKFRSRSFARFQQDLVLHAGDALVLGPAGVAAGDRVVVGFFDVVRHGCDPVVGAVSLSVDDVKFRRRDGGRCRRRRSRNFRRSSGRLINVRRTERRYDTSTFRK